MKKSAKIVIVVMIAGILVLAALRLLKKDPPVEAVPLPNVSVEAPVRADIILESGLIGTVEPSDIIHVTPKVAGEIVETGTVEEVYLNPRHPYTCGLFDSIPKLDEDSTKLVPIDGMTPNMAEPPTGCYFHPRCKYCQDICKTQSPAMTGGSHRFKCFFPLGNPEDEKGE